MDTMQYWEAEEILCNLQYYGQPEWERCRLLLHAAISPYSKKKLMPKELMEFPWEKDAEIKPETKPITDDDIDRLRDLSKKFTKK